MDAYLMNGWMDGFTFDELTDECMFDVCRHGWIDGFMNG